MINAQISGSIGTTRTRSRFWRPGTTTFWVLLAVQGALLLAIAFFLLSQLPEQTPLSSVSAAQEVRDFVVAGGSSDPLIEIIPGVIDRASTLRGLRVDGQIYYYYYEGRTGYDPLSRGAVAPEHVELLLRDESGPNPLIVYRMLNS